MGHIALNLFSIILGLTITLATFCGLAGSLWWQFELLDHFRWQYCWLLLIPLLMGLWQQQRWSLVWLVPLALNSALILSLAWPTQGVVDSSLTGPSLTILHANIDHQNRQPTEVIDYVDSQVVDIVFFQEITPTTLPIIVEQLNHYRLVAAEPKTNSHGSAMFVPLDSSLEIVQKQIIQVPNYSQRPLLTVDVRLGETIVSLMSVHITRPGNAGASKFQNIEFQSVADWSRRQIDADKSVVIIGDFNSTGWSQRVRKMMVRGNLKNSQQGWIWQMTWPGNLPILFQIAIDHCLYSPDLITQQRTIGPYVGSDHLPLTVTLSHRT
ncbi:endonuclease/exonuclease/phosphatase family protein [Leptothoe spongobia]|uniref:Endonuclease/exonuclease/phosphatase family protein n=1 Tax=Leptothoe spongobia TAU-MAC 1115 TaxID=1967444 RepID=A0A947DHR8_9CYAN|nr:endonuclease/exonuclease/phosphatase family protein [Leptothoe spongobia]MBT9317407.1 endonuclease/exonuclease/phosphatase family protein [Leptothoe spongobia TAU-MAC 1115]